MSSTTGHIISEERYIEARERLKAKLADSLTFPPGWKILRIRDVAKVVSGSTPKSGVQSFWNGDIAWVGPADLGQLTGAEISRGARSITEAGYRSCAARLVPAGSVVMSSRAPIGYLAIAQNELCTNQGCKTFVPTEEINSRFLYWALRWSMPTIKSLGTGNTFTEVSGSTLANYPIPVAPLTEQRRIADRLDAAMAEIAAARVALDRQRALAAKLLDAERDALLDGVDGQRVTIGDVCELDGPLVDPRTPDHGHLPCVSAEHIESATGRLSPVPSAAEQKMISGKYRYRAGVVLYSKLRPYLRKVSIAPWDGLCSADMYPLRAGAEIRSSYLQAILLSNDFTEYAHELSRRARMPKLNREQLAAYNFAVPSPARQDALTARLDQLAARIGEAEASLTAEAAALDALGPAILSAAFRGDL